MNPHFFKLFQVIYKSISFYNNVVNYDNDSGWTNIFDKFKKQLSEISEESKNIIFDIQTAINNGFKPDFSDGFVGEIEIADKSLKNFLKTWDGTGDLMEQYQQHLSNATSANTKFVASLKSIAANMAIMLAINVGIKLLAKAWDTLNVTVEEQTAKIDELQSSYNSLKSEYDELSQKQDLTDSEKRRLEYHLFI